jgi:hypothetical protein
LLIVLIEPENAARDLPDLVHGNATQAWLEKTIADWRKRGLLKG